MKIWSPTTSVVQQVLLAGEDRVGHPDPLRDGLAADRVGREHLVVDELLARGRLDVALRDVVERRPARHRPC